MDIDSFSKPATPLPSEYLGQPQSGKP
jgi:serine/threonine-protein phosphatase 2A regulatory subunit B